MLKKANEQGLASIGKLGNIPFVHVAAAIIWDQDKFLAAKRPEGKPRSGYWEFPGGKQEQGESLEETLRRELSEELSIEAGVIVPWCSLFHEYHDLHVSVHFMHVLSYAGRMLSLEGQELRFVTREEALGLRFLPADLKILENVRRPS